MADKEWKVQDRTTRSELGYQVESIMIVGEIGGKSERTIAEIGCWKDRENPEADANLISAAPDQNKALERAREDINWMLNNEKFLNPEVFDYIDKALAKAEGQPLTK